MWHLGRHHPEIKEIQLQRDVRTYRQEARNNIIKEARAWNATHCLMLDDDMVFEPDVFDKLWDVSLNAETPTMVSALYFTRGLPLTAPCMFRWTGKGTVPLFEYPDNQILTSKDGVEVLGFGFVLFDMRIFDHVQEPWFNLGVGFGEDAAFCARLLQNGLDVSVHTGAKVGHIFEDPQVITEQTYLQAKEYMKQGAVYEDSQLVRIEGPSSGGSRAKTSTLARRSGWRGTPTKLIRFFGGSRRPEPVVGRASESRLGTAHANGDAGERGVEGASE